MVDYAVLTQHGIKIKESEKKEKYLDLVRDLKKKNYGTRTNMKVTVIPVVIGALGTIPKRFGKRTGRLENQDIRKHPDYSIIKID